MFLWYNAVMDDLDFVHKFVEGDTAAREEFFKRYARLIYNYIHQILTSKRISTSSDHASDIYQSFIAFILEDNCRRLRLFKGLNNCSLATWIRQLTVNFTLGYLRKIKPVVSLDTETEEGFSLQDALADKSPQPRQILDTSEISTTLKDCIESLSVEEKLIVELNFYRKLTLESIKVLFKTTRGALDMKKSRLIVKLRDCFKLKGFKLDF